MKTKKLDKRVTLFAAILEPQYEALREIAFKEKRSLAEVTRRAIDTYLRTKVKDYPSQVETREENEKEKIVQI